MFTRLCFLVSMFTRLNGHPSLHVHPFLFSVSLVSMFNRLLCFLASMFIRLSLCLPVSVFTRLSMYTRLYVYRLSMFTRLTGR